MDKESIRREALSKRDLLTAEEIEEKSRQIFLKLTELPVYTEAVNVLIYSSMRSEVRTDEIILDLFSLGKKVFCPKVTDKQGKEMEFVRIFSLEDLEKGYFSIREPRLEESSELFVGDMEGKSLVIMPGAAFDHKRNRVGYGGGFYDRYLRKYSDLSTLALCFDVQISDEIIDSEENDVKPQVILSETERIGLVEQ